ncbi:hypothetical protein FAES_3224 [Fibrella aestuarina BUZ 2]|uniref:Uncharacterized protein n=1 Tax=Fibrella aestuarina BUZ 2 TaxID=1166018 RepID=I0KAT0_9BACT|nr:hypothetical protein [Fibrella aestuarina]CCH01233.1 hypothetical protein FAES_3224 [Fibrella aestuarina BUZ 2]
MATTIIDDLRWFSYGGKENLEPQQIPTHDELIAFGAEVSDSTLQERHGTEPLPEGRDERLYWIDSKECSRTMLTYVPDAHGWYVENSKGFKWRPKDLNDLYALMDEMDQQYERYGDLLQ